MSYELDHAEVLADLALDGVSVTFTLTTPGAHNEVDGSFAAPTTETIPGKAVAVRGDPERFRALGLILESSILLLFAPTTYGGIPTSGYTVTWGSVVYTVKATEAIAPDGTAILSYVWCTV